MASPSKRQRRDSDASKGCDEQEKKSVAPKPREGDDALWYDDGNIILATDEHLYRVHKSVLARHSTAFKDMFQVAGETREGEGSDASASEPWEGIPVVKMVDDNDQDVYNFVKAFYYHNFSRGHQPSSFTYGVLNSLFLLSHKYDAVDMRAELLSYISTFYPDTLKAYDDGLSTNFLSDYDNFVAPELAILGLMKECNASNLMLPALFYACAASALEDILSETKVLEKEDFHTIIVGREKMMKQAYAIASEILLHGKNVKCRSQECVEKRAAALVAHLDFASSDPPKFPLQFSVDDLLPADSASRNLLCKQCTKAYRESIKTFRSSFWELLPSFFNLPSWVELRQQGDHGKKD